MWELDHKEGWALKNWCFWTVVLKKTIERSLDCKEIKQSILKKINPECTLEGLMLKLKLCYFGHLMQRANSLEKTLMLGKIESRKRRGWQRMRWLDDIIYSMDRSLSKLWEIVKGREDWHAAVHGVTKSQTQQSDWITTAVNSLKGFARTVVTKYTGLGSLVSRIIFSRFRRLKVQDQGAYKIYVLWDLSVAYRWPPTCCSLPHGFSMCTNLSKVSVRPNIPDDLILKR